MFEDLKPHIQDLRRCLIRIVLALLVTFLASFYFWEIILEWMIAPLASALPNGRENVIFTQVGEAFFTAIYSSVRNFNWKAKFVTFFHCVFRNELIREINNSSRCFTLCNYVSLDSTVDNEDRPICESISSKEDNLDPVNYASYRLLLEDLKHLPPSFDAMSAKVVALLLKGFRAHEIAEILHLTDYRVRYIISSVRDYVRQKYDFVPDK